MPAATFRRIVGNQYTIGRRVKSLRLPAKTSPHLGNRTLTRFAGTSAGRDSPRRTPVSVPKGTDRHEKLLYFPAVHSTVCLLFTSFSSP